MAVRWALDKEQFLRDHHNKMSFGELAARLKMTRSQISGKVDRLGLSTGTPRSRRKGGKPRHKAMKSWTPATQVRPYEEQMPQLTGDQKLHSRAWKDLEPGMCNWPLYVEQGVQMYCAAQTERLPGRYDVYCKCHREMSQRPREERRAKYKQGIWAR